jgi:S1-C subfamily serine protease
MKYRAFVYFFVLITASCGSEQDKPASLSEVPQNSYTSEFKENFINDVISKKCSSYIKRDMDRYSKCTRSTSLELGSIDWEMLDQLKENQKNNILSPCKSMMIRDTNDFSYCLNKQLISFQELPLEQKESLNVISRPKNIKESIKSDGWGNIFNSSNQNTNNLSAENIFKMFEKSVFMVLASNQGGGFSKQGSAVAVSKDMLFTNCHVVLNANNIPYDIIALANDSVDKSAWFNATVFKMSPRSDQCILKSTQKNNLQHIPVGRQNSELRVGEEVLALGYPKASDLNFDSKYRAPLTLSMGIVSAVREKDSIMQIQTDAFIINGSSGGALLDMKGNLIGITTSGFEGTQLNFAIAADEFKKL